MKSLSSWMLAGALAASLTWNWSRSRAAAPAAEDAPACAARSECAPHDLALTDEQRAALTTLCARSCAESDRLEREADALQRELLARLSADEVDEAEVARLVAAVAELRERSLAECVQGLIEVRAAFSPAEVRALLAGCAQTEGACR